MEKEFNYIKTVWPLLAVLGAGYTGYITLQNDIGYMKADAAVLKSDIRDANRAYTNIEKELASLKIQSARIEERLIAMQRAPRIREDYAQ
jgi:Tfp pilus assembly protein PilO